MTRVEMGVVVGPSEGLLPGEGRAYAVGERQIAVFRMTDGTFRATDAVCPHRGGPLADGQFDLGQIVCPLHQYAFRFRDGGCASEGIGAVAVYRAEDRDGEILVWV
ncbi:Rieske 2Fe-2S domain-containing protein [Gordonia sp. SID5947]|uniref:Rieske (2Fe-2S) protein n=1 Tax=Gordonia sp. SID5947 TaxID=2690315 RepID=UPI00136A8E5D|nr:Rieske (2Fe-2S) protein [Gordonia sp. SID5947]MYR06472.1 Rieske 2Fe-2S domain-containing protein [Gordonia sp. SID5947]